MIRNKKISAEEIKQIQSDRWKVLIGGISINIVINYLSYNFLIKMFLNARYLGHSIHGVHIQSTLQVISNHLTQRLLVIQSL